MNTKYITPKLSLLLACAVVLFGCTEKKPISPSGVAIEKTLNQAEKDAR
jgi:hypothetical protein